MQIKVIFQDGTTITGTKLLETDDSVIIDTAHGRLTADKQQVSIESYQDGAQYDAGSIVKTERGYWLKTATNVWRLLWSDIPASTDRLTDQFIQNAQQVSFDEVLEKIQA